MAKPFQKWLMEQAAAKMPPGQMLAFALKQLLGLSDSAAYKKIRSESELGSEEIAAIAQHFDISLDRYVHSDKPGRASFYYPPLGQAFRSPADLLRILSAEMAHILSTPQPSVWYATNEVPIFHYMPHPCLLAFKLYIWSRISWALPDYARAKFSATKMYEQCPAIEQHRQEIAAFYAQVPTREYWPLHILDHTLNQIRHCAQARFFAEADTPRTLLAELRAMLYTSLEAAHSGHKLMTPDEPGGGFDLFFNEIGYTNNVILIFSEGRPVTLFTTLDNPNFIKSADTEICQKMEQWIGRIERSAVRISGGGEQQRHWLFEHVEAKIKGLEQELEMLAA